MKKSTSQTNRRKLLLHSGIIRTLDPAHPVAQAMVIDRERIAWVGDNEDIISIPADEYDLLNLSGKTVLPSFADAHVHLAFLARTLSSLDLFSCRSYDEALGCIRKFASTLSRGEWLLGKGWSIDRWAEPRLPHKRDLDRIVPDNPAALYSKDQHLVWTNSLGLKTAGIDEETPDPDGGRIYRDEDKSPTGILAENAAAGFYQNIDPAPRKKSFDQIDRAVAECHRNGVTAVGSFDDIDGFELLQEYNSTRGLRVRVRQYVPVRFLDHLLQLRLKSGFGDRYLKIAGVKLYADGALGSRTALMFEPYSGTRDRIGIEVSTEAEMTERIRAAASNGLACAVHAIGDRANHQALNAFEKLPRKLRHLRHRIEHVQITKPDDIRRFSELGVIASVQPSHCSADIDMARKHWGKRSRNAYNFRKLIDSGAMLAFGSDAPIEPVDPLRGIYSATTRRSLDGRKLFHPEQRITIGEAIAGFTTGAAYALADEDLYGIIAPGKYADIVIVGRDPFETRKEDLRNAEIEATFFEGECVYGWNNIRN